jgi:hypothetical protein
VGFETECKIGKGVNFFHYDKGWHPTSTLGIFGAAAASAKGQYRLEAMTEGWGAPCWREKSS